LVSAVDGFWDVSDLYGGHKQHISAQSATPAPQAWYPYGQRAGLRRGEHLSAELTATGAHTHTPCEPHNEIIRRKTVITTSWVFALEWYAHDPICSGC
jgi:hypothetical protein